MPEMSDTNRVTVFFYGLFMDVEMLVARGCAPAGARHAVVRGFELRIGRRATLVARPGALVHGMVMSMRRADLERLYADTSLVDYAPITVQASVGVGEEVEALAYVLSRAPDSEEGSSEYAAKLRDLCRRLDFPLTYVDSIR